MVWWIASGADDEQYKGRTASREVFLSRCDELFGLVQSPLSLSLLGLYQISLSLFPLWWLVLLIEALGLSPNNEREGRQQLAILKGNI